MNHEGNIRPVPTIRPEGNEKSSTGLRLKIHAKIHVMRKKFTIKKKHTLKQDICDS